MSAPAGTWSLDPNVMKWVHLSSGPFYFLLFTYFSYFESPHSSASSRRLALKLGKWVGKGVPCWGGVTAGQAQRGHNGAWEDQGPLSGVGFVL